MQPCSLSHTPTNLLLQHPHTLNTKINIVNIKKNGNKKVNTKTGREKKSKIKKDDKIVINIHKCVRKLKDLCQQQSVIMRPQVRLASW